MKTDIRTRRRALFASAAAPAIALALIATSVHAQEPAKTFSIAPQPLADALLQLSRQADVDIVASTDLTRGRTAPRIDGQMTTADAMSALLAGSGLVAAPSGAGYVITRASDPQSGSAAGDGADAGTVQALVVTAQKREENIQDVPIAMSAFTQEDLTRSQVTGGPDLMTQVPNFTFTKTNFTGYSIQIRGIGTQAISATTDAAVAVAENNTPFIRNRFFEQEFYDLERVEVLRGPQGTLYGRNATAGVVNVLTAKPKFTYDARLSADVGNYNSTRFEGMLNIPLVDDKVALRVAGAWTKRDGYDTNQITGNRIDGRDLWSTRLSLRFEPTDSVHANLIWEHFKEDDDRLRSAKQLCHTDVVTHVAGFDTPDFYQTLPEWGQSALFSGVQGIFSQGCKATSLYAPESFQTPNGLSLPYYGPLAMVGTPIVGGGLEYTDPYVSRTQSHDLRVIESTVDPQYKADTDTVELQFAIDLSKSFTLTSETGYNSDSIFSMEDFNRFNTTPGVFKDNVDALGSGISTYSGTRVDLLKDGYFCDPQIGCANRLVAVDLSTAKSRQFSQEFRLASNFEGAFNFSLGANFLRYDTEDKYYVFINTLSLYAGLSPWTNGRTGNRGPISPYVPNQTDNSECLKGGFVPPDVNGGQSSGGCVYMDPNPIGSLNDLGHNYFLSRNPYKLVSYAVFGEGYYNITPDLKLTAGLRWTVDKKVAPRIPSWVLGADSVGYPVAEVVKQEWREPTGRLALDWKPHLSFTDESLLYASYAHGYKAGGANPPSSGLVYDCGCQNLDVSPYVAYNAAHPKTFEPEFVNAYEVGTKNTLLDGKVTLNADAFYYDYTGYQISQIVDRSAVNLNFDARVWGLELESDWRPVENLRLGLKLGYENTRVADGSKAIDLMDRTAGDPNWVVVSPFPTFPSNCVLPAWLFVGNEPAWTGSGTNPGLVDVGGQGGGNPGGCEFTYVMGYDPATGAPYTADPYNQGTFQFGESFRTDINYAAWSTNRADYPCLPAGADPATMTDYPGVDPQCIAAMSNNGAGLFKNLSGNELPNAPHITATLTADYTLPLPNSWLMTLHGDFYYQSEGWARIFNTPGYDKLKAYNNVNFAVIFTNEDAGWKVMAYVKNVFDKDNITGAFLNSDDTGLTTNVFMNEPRLYGLRVTKEWNGGPWWTGANPNHTGPYPLTVELGGEVQRWDGSNEKIAPEALSDMSDALDISNIQNRRLDWGDGRFLKITYRPDGSSWWVSGAARYGRTNSRTSPDHHEELSDVRACKFPESFYGGIITSTFCNPESSKYSSFLVAKPTDWSAGASHHREEHTIVDFDVGREVGMGSVFRESALGVGLRYAAFKSSTNLQARGVGDWDVPDGWYFNQILPTKYLASHSGYVVHLNSERQFKGAGPTVSWDAATPLLGNDDTGHLNVDWSVTGGVLFGKQRTSTTGQDAIGRYQGDYGLWPQPQISVQSFTPPASRSKSVSVPLVDLSLGLSYDIQRIKVSTGYRWERYFNVLDTGYAERKQADRTIDGPYFKIAVGFGG